MESFKEETNPETNAEVLQIENKIKEFLPIEKIKEIFGENTYLIGGCVRDVILNKNVTNSDLDLMTRTSLTDIESRLSQLGYVKNNESKFSEKGYSMKDGMNVINILINGKEVQVGLIGNKDIDELIKLGDLNINCCAYDIGAEKIINPGLLEEIKHRELKFCSPESAQDNVMKIVSALKQISRLPDLHVPDETREIITKSMPVLIQYFKNNPQRLHKLRSLFGNINSQEVKDLFQEFEGDDILKDVIKDKGALRVSERYHSSSIENLNHDTKNKIIDLMVAHYGKRVDKNKIFNQKINSVSYEVDDSGNVIACCLIDKERLYAVSATNSESLVNLAADLCKCNYNIWATIAITSRHLINLSLKAGLKPVTDPEIVKKILIANYPEYKGRITTESKFGYTTFSKIESSDAPQVLLLS